MSAAPIPDLISLVGYMGAGKTTVGQALALELACPFQDLDRAVEEFERATVSEIFTRSGQSAFRRAEVLALQRILETKGDGRMVLALGGGAFLQSGVTALLDESSAATVFLSASPDELWHRCMEERPAVSRPLLQDRAAFEALYRERLPYYQRAHLRVETGGKPVAQVVSELLAAFAGGAGK